MEKIPLPSKYVTILDLKERWLREQKLKQQLPQSDQLDSQFDPNRKPKPDEDAAGRVPRRGRRNRMRNRRRTSEETESQVKVAGDDSHFKTEAAVDVVERETGLSSSKFERKKSGGGNRKPRAVSAADDGNPIRGATPPVQPRHQFLPNGGGGWRRLDEKQKVVWEPKIKPPPFAVAPEELSSNAAAVEKSNVRVGGSGRRGVSGRFQGKPRPKPKTWSRETLVWVKKGESAAN